MHDLRYTALTFCQSGKHALLPDHRDVLLLDLL